MTQAPTPSLLQQVAAGQSQAVSEVIDAYGGLVWSLARKYFGRSAEAEDAVQDAFIAVWKSAERFDPEVAGESTYIAMIARRRMIDQRGPGLAYDLLTGKQIMRPHPITLEPAPWASLAMPKSRIFTKSVSSPKVGR